MIDWKIFWDYFGKGLMFAIVFTSAAILTVVILKDKEPVKSETVVLLQDIEEITSGSTVLLVQILHKTDGMVTVQDLDSVLQAKSSTAGVTTKTE